MRYYFDLRDDKGKTRDELGTELRDLAGARQEARRILTGLAADEPFDDRLRLSLQVRDEAGHEVYALALGLDASRRG
jgi:hypothetical protein